MKSFTVTLNTTMAEAENAIRNALGENGFGVLTEMDVAATLKAKIDVDRPALKILGACNPTFAHEALQLDPTVALMLPCNVVLEETPEGGTKVSAVDPRELMSDPSFAGVAEGAAAKLKAAIESLRS